MGSIAYRKASIENISELTEVALLLYDEHTYDEIYSMNAKLLTDERKIMFIASDKGKVIGLSQSSLRHDYVEGTHGGTIGYLEGIFVLQEYRKQGIARELVLNCEKWAKEKGCKEFASDCQIHNTESYDFHIKVGFSEVNRVICFTKKL